MIGKYLEYGKHVTTPGWAGSLIAAIAARSFASASIFVALLAVLGGDLPHVMIILLAPAPIYAIHIALFLIWLKESGK
ncbi:hypothetical protein ACSSNL_18140 [Thalassobius sp. S69A]|uniref:hypothetical protein n=1 Tax=unclassified Thalassovita TaxID=2619711 RepID=UPI003C79B4F9